ncbi:MULTISPECIES: LysR substrate-binding domain-containing protein [Ensifer]|uniref:LysR substrate-binding domain-containing protein n=1 Tax=Ensifer TaxID=106591 RepID=UPI00070AD0D9|nr:MULTISPECIES: LysR substrate-binding domain-containing protein [Ensifer]KQU88830.1 hypothetical protein ASD00_28130 [Ensifer sp. Root31]
MKRSLPTADGLPFRLDRTAVIGQGVALVRGIYAREEIADGRLAVALDRPWPSEFAYYIVTLPAATERPAIAHFVDWLMEEAQARHFRGSNA